MASCHGTPTLITETPHRTIPAISPSSARPPNLASTSISTLSSPRAAATQATALPLAGPGLGFTVDTVTTLLRMVVSGLFDEIPSLRLVLGHLGEGLPFLLDRIENRIKFLPNPAIRCRRPLRYYFQHNIWVTTSGNMSPEAFRCTQDVLGMDHILFASDYPYESVEDMMAFLRGIPLNEADYARLYYQNAEALLGISLS